MADNKYLIIRNYSNNGEIGISYQVFESIAADVVSKTKGVKLNKGHSKSSAFNLYHPITCSSKKDGAIKINIDISIKKSVNIPETCFKIKNEVHQNLALTCENKNFDVVVNVANVEI